MAVEGKKQKLWANLRFKLIRHASAPHNISEHDIQKSKESGR